MSMPSTDYYTDDTLGDYQPTSRGNNPMIVIKKYKISNLVHMTRFWNNLHHVRSNRNIGKPNNITQYMQIKDNIILLNICILDSLSIMISIRRISQNTSRLNINFSNIYTTCNFDLLSTCNSNMTSFFRFVHSHCHMRSPHI